MNIKVFALCFIAFVCSLTDGTSPPAPWAPLFTCKKPTVITDFDKNRYMGEWIEAYRSYNLFELNTRCNHAVFKPDGARVDIEVDQKSRVLGDVKFPLIAVPDAKQPSRMTAYTQGWMNLQAQYMVLDTDYDTYSLVYLCLWNQYLPTIQTDAVWLLARGGVTLELDFVVEMRKKLRNHGIYKSFVKVDQRECRPVNSPIMSK